MDVGVLLGLGFDNVRLVVLGQTLWTSQRKLLRYLGAFYLCKEVFEGLMVVGTPSRHFYYDITLVQYIQVISIPLGPGSSGVPETLMGALSARLRDR